MTSAVQSKFSTLLTATCASFRPRRSMLSAKKSARLRRGSTIMIGLQPATANTIPGNPPPVPISSQRPAEPAATSINCKESTTCRSQIAGTVAGDIKFCRPFSVTTISTKEDSRVNPRASTRCRTHSCASISVTLPTSWHGATLPTARPVSPLAHGQPRREIAGGSHPAERPSPKKGRVPSRNR